MEFTLLVLMATLGWKVVDTVNFVREGKWQSLITQVAAWATGISLMFLGSATDWAAQEEVNGVILSDLNSASKVLAGMALLSVAGVAKDLLSKSD